MKLLVGLGNPGKNYAFHRHNIGFMAVDSIAAAHNFGPWKTKFNGLFAEGRLGREKVVLLKPETFMNLSGQSVNAALRFYKVDLADVVVFHDELDLAPGKVRVKKAGGHAGHNGLRSLHQHIGPEYHRVRLGIGHPGHKDRVAGYVLHDFAKADQDWLEAILRGIAEGAVDLAEGDSGRFMNKIALQVAPPRSSTTPQKPRKSPSEKRQPAPTSAPKPAPVQKPTPAPELEPVPGKSALQKLVDKFR